MLLFPKLRILFCISIYAASLMTSSAVYAVMDPRFELDPQVLTETQSSRNSNHSRVKLPHRNKSIKKDLHPSKGALYTVKQGDHLFKILMRDYGLSNSEAESFIEEIKRENNIYDIRRLKIGQRITIPPVRRRSDGSLRLVHSLSDGRSGSVAEQNFKLESPVSPLSDQEKVSKVQDVWNNLVPAKKEHQQPIDIKTPNFSLTLDPARYPTFARMDGGRIVLDQNGSIPPLVRSLIEGKDSSVRIVSEPPSGTKQFMSSLLGAAGFYSVEENYSMEFGDDPKLSIQTDFKVEKTADSLIKQDVVLVNSGMSAFPASFGEFLKKEGFSLYEPFASLKPFVQRNSRTIYYISAKNQQDMIDPILSAFSVTAERDRSVDVFAADNNGITLSVKAERYFERGGKRYVVTNYDGDPINYTLFRILETKGYNVVILEAKDDFRRISEKIISRMKIKGQFAQHSLLQDRTSGYLLQMSGFKLDDATLPGDGIFLTDRSMDSTIRDLVIENGFNIK